MSESPAGRSSATDPLPGRTGPTSPGSRRFEESFEGILGGLPVVRWLPLENVQPRRGWVTFDGDDSRVVHAAQHAYADRLVLRGVVRGADYQVFLTDWLESAGRAVYHWVELGPTGRRRER